MQEGKLEDPADKVVKKEEEKRMEDEGKAFDVTNLSFEDFKAIPPHVAKSVHPFEGYPMGKEISIGKDQKGKDRMVSSTYIVGLNPKVYVHQDPSGKGISIEVKEGKKVFERIVNIPTSHSRLVRDYESGDVNREYVFDRTIKLKDGTINCCIVDSHTARAQICFNIEPRSGKIIVDDRYLLLDFKQRNLLRRTFNMIHTPQARIERLSKIITGESDEAMEEADQTPLEE